MSSTTRIGYEVSHDEQQSVEEFEAVEEPELRPSVAQEIDAKVDGIAPGTVSRGMSLEDEERMVAREWEVRRTRVRWDRRQDSDREVRTRSVVEDVNAKRRHEIGKRAASVDRWADPDIDDPRVQLSRVQLGEVNRQAARLAGELRGWSRGAISRRLAERVVDGVEMLDAVVAVYDELTECGGQVIPISRVEQVDEYEVDIEGVVSVLWEPSCAAIRQVGLLEDQTGRIKFTSWRKSGQPLVREGERVRLRAVAKNWYEGRCSVALTGKTLVSFPGQDRQ
ncbi:DNA-binding protein [Halapricum salinum]|uniref:DNA-binding protein n=1 Tax=Halapricum salinum TaxID=1457250 RepID=A0A4D6HBS2_9EURY|nr:DNA-binding protein [Halapricum salinum]QCC51399.1 DNA-binding protein [Halapricum salinum]